jgi:molecular chaperone GrpE
MTILAKSNNITEKKEDTANKANTKNKSSASADATKEKETTKAAADSKSDSNSIANIKKELSGERDKYLRLAAEYDNFRKRSAKEREMTYTDARTDAISKLLPVYDNLERALKMECSDEAFYKGVEMIMTQLTETLSDMGVREISAVGEPFDPNLHNAVMTIEDTKLGKNIIAEEYQKGFTLGDRVIRFSTVVVAN